MREEKKNLQKIGKVTVNVPELFKYLETEQAIQDYVEKYPTEIGEENYSLANQNRYTNQDTRKDNYYWKGNKKIFKVLYKTDEQYKPYYSLDNPLKSYIKLVNDFLEVVTLDVYRKVDLGYHIILPKKSDKSWFIPAQFIVSENIYQTFDELAIN